MFKKLVSIALVLVLSLFISNSFAQTEGFEGMVKFNVEAQGNAADMKYFMKGDKLRIEMAAPQKVVMINDSEGMKMLIPQRQMYMSFSEGMMDQMNRMRNKSKYPSKEDMTEDEFMAKIDEYRTGKTKEIKGHECEQWIVPSGNNEIEMWVTHDFGNFMGFSNPMSKQQKEGWQRLVGDTNFFPMEVITKDDGGNVVSTFKVKEIEEKSVSESLFQIPDGYKEMNMMGMPK
jgi:hypothetical protein